MSEESQHMPFLSEEDIRILKADLLAEFSETQQQSFIRTCERTRLDPFSGQIIPIKRNKKVKDPRTPKGFRWETQLSKITTVGGLTSVAISTGQYDGCTIEWVGQDDVWKDAWLDTENYPVAARCTVQVKNRALPEVGIAHFRSYAQTFQKEDGTIVYSDFWRKMPEFMIGKCAKALALRGAFPDRMGDLYAREEMQGMDEEPERETDEQKIGDSQRREYQLKAEGVKFVPSRGKRPTAAEAMEPAFAEDKSKPAAEEPRTPPFAEKLAEEQTQTTVAQAAQNLGTQQWPPQPEDTGMAEQVLRKDQEAEKISQAMANQRAEEADDLDMTPAPPQPEAKPQEQTPRPAWMDHVIRTIAHPRFQGKKVSELAPSDLAKIESQWIPKIEAKMAEASPDQKLEYEFFQSAIAHGKSVKPF